MFIVSNKNKKGSKYMDKSQPWEKGNKKSNMLVTVTTPSVTAAVSSNARRHTRKYSRWSSIVPSSFCRRQHCAWTPHQALLAPLPSIRFRSAAIPLVSTWIRIIYIYFQRD